MTGRRRRAAGLAVAASATVLLAALSRAPQAIHAGDDGLVRLSWSGQPERIEVCRDVPASELANLPRHMRQAVVCEGHAASYHLALWADEAVLVDETVSGGGVRHDRPVYLYREVAIAPGSHRLRVRFTRVEAVGEPRDSGPVPSARRRIDRFPPVLDLDTTVIMPPRAVVLVTFDPARGAFVLRTGS